MIVLIFEARRHFSARARAGPGLNDARARGRTAAIEFCSSCIFSHFVIFAYIVTFLLKKNTQDIESVP